MTRRPRRLATPGWGNAYRAEVGRRMREIREAAGLSQRELARRAGITPGMLCLVEQGQTSPSTATATRLADALGVTLGELRQRLANDR
jgi:transcriptional regulator with XRE-family HTH domain